MSCYLFAAICAQGYCVSSDPVHQRREYEQSQLRRAQLSEDPLRQFERWLDDAVQANLLDATAMALATADANGRPTNRMVLLKGFSAAGFVWYTDYRSRKGSDLEVNAQGALLFYWRELERQVRIVGTVQKLSRAESEAYFRRRPQESQVAAAASHQSAQVAARDVLEQRVLALSTRYPDGDVPLPTDWGGYRLRPEEYEFWQGRVGRLHDRFSYTRVVERWQIQRLQP